MGHPTLLRCIAALTGLILSSSAGFAQQRGTVAFEDNFESALKPEWSYKTISTTPKGQRKFLGPIGAESVELNLKSLAPHRFVRLTFDAYALRSWDGNEPGNGPDVLLIQSGDGRTLFATTFGIFILQSFPGWYGIHSAIAYSGAKERDVLGYTFNGEPRDGVYPIEVVFPHTEQTLALRFMMYGDGIMTDEAWGLDNVKVTLDDVTAPTPAQLEQAWQNLAGDDAAAATKAVYELVSGEAQTVAFLAGKLRGRTLPFEPPGLNAAAARFRPRAAEASITQNLNDPAERQLALSAHVLSIIDTEPSMTLRKQLLPEPRDLITAFAIVRDSQTRQVIPHVPIRVLGAGDSGRYPLFTNDDGELVFKFSPGPATLTYTTPRRTYIPVSGSLDAGNAGRMVDGKLEILLERGVPIGGEVMDADGKPAAGAILKFQIQGSPAPNLWDPAAIADEQGKWNFEIVPRNLQQVSIGVFHPNQALTSSNMLQMAPYPNIEQLRQGAGRIILRGGTPINGMVKDSDGKPIAHAWVDWGSERGAISPIVPSLPTDAQGRFRFTAMPGQTAILTAKGSGYNLEQKTLQIGNDPATVEFTLRPSKRVTGKVITTGGAPIFGVRMYVGQWRGEMMFDIGFTTDREGRFTWPNAPDEEVLGSVSLQGYQSQSFTFRPGQENVITLKGPTIVQGKVFDAETGQPLRQFRASYAMVRGAGISAWQPTGATSADGGFEIKLTTPDIQGIVVRVEADGYLATNSEPIPMDGATKQVELKLFSAK